MTKSGKWALHYDHCVSCGRTGQPHQSAGRCRTCVQRERLSDRHEAFVVLQAERAERSRHTVALYRSGLTAREVGELTGDSVGAVKGLLLRAKVGKVGGKHQRVGA